MNISDLRETYLQEQYEKNFLVNTIIEVIQSLPKFSETADNIRYDLTKALNEIGIYEW